MVKKLMPLADYSRPAYPDLSFIDRPLEVKQADQHNRNRHQGQVKREMTIEMRSYISRPDGSLRACNYGISQASGSAMIAYNPSWNLPSLALGDLCKRI
ncbi:hypothetical protein AAKU55_002026 [Oxalobacteraceae bacterium GrIS 1.11]